MKKFNCLFRAPALSCASLLFTLHFLLFTFNSNAQGITKHGEITTIGANYIGKNGGIGGSIGNDKNGKQITAVSLPSVTTISISSIKGSTATSGGTLTSTGGLTVTDRGVCWNTTSTTAPTITDNILSQGATGSTGAYTSSLTGLAQNTLYYLRAYATNSEGTAYGETFSFTTISIAIGDNMQGGIVYALVRDGNDNVTGGSVVSGDKGKKSRNDLTSIVYEANSGTGLGGFKGWLAPGSPELKVICTNKNSVGMRNVTVAHWSSDATEAASQGATGSYVVYFDRCEAGFMLIRNPGASSDNMFNVRLIRNFTL